MSISFNTTVPADGLSIEAAIESLSDDTIEALIDICEGWVDENVYEDGFLFEFDTNEQEEYPYTQHMADELIENGLVTISQNSVPGEWYVTVNADVIVAMAEMEGLDTENELPEL